MRKKNVGSPPTIIPKATDGVIIQEREYELITPLFGGGVQPKEADPVNIIRGTEIRGQLRFWWRACRGGQFGGDLAKMKEAEDNLWGKANKKNETGVSLDNTVQIVVDTLHDGTHVQTFDMNGKPLRNSPVPPYAAFPLQPDDSKGIKPGEVRQGVKFKLTISFPETKEKDIKAALWAWETFGGIGGRTRRGFGALRLRKVDGQEYTDIPSAQDVDRWIQEKLAGYIPAENFPTGVPHLSKNLQFRSLFRPGLNTPEIAWGSLIRALRDFRQRRTKGISGRSLWPEAETIRDITGHRSYRNQPLPHAHKFPRAAFGLPVIFHFKDEKDGDPKDTTLEGSDSNGKLLERLASPLLLRPFLCNNAQSVGLAVILEGTHPLSGPLRLSEQGNANKYNVQEQLSNKDVQQMMFLNGETDVLKAFLNTLN